MLVINFDKRPDSVLLEYITYVHAIRNMPHTVSTNVGGGRGGEGQKEQIHAHRQTARQPDS